jgi:hypothetical protein
MSKKETEVLPNKEIILEDRLLTTVYGELVNSSKNWRVIRIRSAYSLSVIA